MIIAKVQHQNQPKWAIVEADTAYALEGDRFTNPRKGAKLGPISGMKLLAPMEVNNKLIGLLGNWRNKGDRDGPGFFIKPPSTLINPGEPVIYPKMAKRIVFEAEIGIVIGKRCKEVSKADAKGYIMGFTVCNDVTAPEMEGKDNVSVLRSKSFDTFGVVGPWVVTGIDGDNLPLKSWVSDMMYHDTNTKEMLWSTSEIVSWISQVMTLFPGDVISCGTPPGYDTVKPGDTMKFTIEGIGTLVNPLVKL